MSSKQARTPPIFRAKPDVDPFALYGPGGDAMSEINFGSRDEDPDLENLQSARVKLALLKAKDKVANQDVIVDADNDLQDIIALQSFQESPVRNQQNQISVKEPVVIVKSKKEAHVVNEEKESVLKVFGQITETFSQIFQMLIVMLEQNPALTQEHSPVDEERISRRSREFEARLNRSVFEAKQKVDVFRGAILKLGFKQNDEQRRILVQKRLHTALRCFILILQAYHKHLPLSGCHVYPKALFKFTDLMTSTAKVAKVLGADMIESCDAMLECSQRLVNAARTIESKMTAHLKSKKVDLSPKPKPKSKKPNSKVKIEMINNLAKEKFGTPTSPAKPRPAMKEIIPKSNKINEHRRSVAKAKLEAEEERKRNDEAVEAEISDHAMSTLMDGLSLKEDIDNDLNCFANNLLNNSSSQKSPEKIKKQPKAILVERKQQQPLSTSEGPGSLEQDRVLALIKQINSTPIGVPLASDISKSKNRTFVEIDPDVLRDIERGRPRDEWPQPPRLPSGGRFQDCESVQVIGEVANQIVLDVVRSICKEAASQDVVSRLINSEFTVGN